MARFNSNQVDNYGSSGGSGYFRLAQDKDVARVRFMYEGIDDIQGFAVHEAEVNGKKRYVNCLREYTDPIDDCPFCAAKKFQIAKVFIPLYNVDENRVQTWDRGKKFFQKLTSLCSRYPDLVSHIFEIERNGKPKDTGTTYEIYEVDHDKTTLDDLPEVPDPLGTIVLDKTAEDMEYYLQEGQFPPTDDEEDNSVRRRSSRQRNDEDDPPFDEDEQPRRRQQSTRQSEQRGRRTPARGRDAF